MLYVRFLKRGQAQQYGARVFSLLRASITLRTEKQSRGITKYTAALLIIKIAFMLSVCLKRMMQRKWQKKNNATQNYTKLHRKGGVNEIEKK